MTPCNSPRFSRLSSLWRGDRRWLLAAAIALATALPAAAAPNASAETALQQANAYYDRHDFRRALPAYLDAAGRGDVRAMTVLGTMYREGEGVVADKKLALQWYERAAAGGHRAARCALADMLESGEGVTRDVPRAARLYEQSAQQGFPQAQFALGLSYEFGQGVARDRRTAVQWLDRAAAQGDGRAGWYSSWLKSPATPRFADPDGLRDYVNRQVDARMLRQMGVGNNMCSMAPWVCSRERAERIWKSEYHPPNTPNPFRN